MKIAGRLFAAIVLGALGIVVLAIMVLYLIFWENMNWWAVVIAGTWTAGPCIIASLYICGSICDKINENLEREESM